MRLRCCSRREHTSLHLVLVSFSTRSRSGEGSAPDSEGTWREYEQVGRATRALIARFTLAGLREYPQLCSRIDTHEDGARSIARFDGVNLGLAVESERGLVVPNLRNADRLSTLELGRRLREIIALARSGKANPTQLSGSTFTLNNYGVFGTDGATPIINHPEVAILGIGRIIDRPWAVDGQIVARKVTTLTLAFDHRVCDGGTAGGFLRFVADAVEDPMSAFLRL